MRHTRDIPAYAGEERRHYTIDRRQRSMPVGRDRRMATADRRGAAYAGA
jgi:hypothetical protein